MYFNGPRRVVEIKERLHPDVAAIDIYFYGYYGDLRPGMHPLSAAYLVPPGERLQAHLVRGAGARLAWAHAGAAAGLLMTCGAHAIGRMQLKPMEWGSQGPEE